MQAWRRRACAAVEFADRERSKNRRERQQRTITSLEFVVHRWERGQPPSLTFGNRDKAWPAAQASTGADGVSRADQNLRILLRAQNRFLSRDPLSPARLERLHLRVERAWGDVIRAAWRRDGCRSYPGSGPYGDGSSESRSRTEYNQIVNTGHEFRRRQVRGLPFAGHANVSCIARTRTDNITGYASTRDGRSECRVDMGGGPSRREPALLYHKRHPRRPQDLANPDKENAQASRLRGSVQPTGQ